MEPIEQISDPEVVTLAANARAYLGSHHWVRRVIGGRVGYAIPGVLGVFQLDLEPTKPDIPSPLWVVTGDVPPAYLPCDDFSTWEEALDGYVGAMQGWVDAVRAGASTDDLIPVAAAPTAQHADMLASRLDFIRTRILDGSDESADSDASDA